MRIEESGRGIEGMAAYCRKIARTAPHRIANIFEDELDRATERVRADTHVHTGRLKESIDSDAVRLPGYFEGTIHHGNDPDAARAAHWERERGGEHNFMRSLESGEFFGRELEEKILDVFRDGAV